MAVSIKAGFTSASTMLERLGSYPRANGLALALREIGRIERPFSPWTGSNILNLVASAIVLWNTTYLAAAIAHLEKLGRPVPPNLWQHLSPRGWQRINLTGDYL